MPGMLSGLRRMPATKPRGYVRTPDGCSFRGSLWNLYLADTALRRRRPCAATRIQDPVNLVYVNAAIPGLPYPFDGLVSKIHAEVLRRADGLADSWRLLLSLLGSQTRAYPTWVLTDTARWPHRGKVGCVNTPSFRQPRFFTCLTGVCQYIFRFSGL